MAMRFVPKDAGVGSGSGSGSGSWDATASLVSVSWETIASLVSVSAIGSNWLSVVVNWKMGIVAPLSGVIPTGGDGPGLR